MALNERDSHALAERRAASSNEAAARHSGFDLSAQDRHMKYERAHFAVVMAGDAYRNGYDRIDWST